jgi:hypothetical protein
MQEILVFIGVGAVCFILGVVLSQKGKDGRAGVPASLRAEFTTLETSIKAQVSSAQKAVVADVKSKVVIQTPVLQTSPMSVMVAAPSPVTVSAPPAWQPPPPDIPHTV